MKIERILINKLKPAKYNPRQITKKQYNDLKDSLDKFSLVEPIVVNRDMTIIGGHQRYKIWKENAKKSNIESITIPCVVLDLNKEQERELNIRLNKSGGEWDMDILANEFDIEELKEWGFKDIEFGFNIDKINHDKEWEGMPEFKQDDKMPLRQIIISFDSQDDIKNFSELLNQNITDKTKSLWYPKKEKNVLKNKGYE